MPRFLIVDGYMFTVLPKASAPVQNDYTALSSSMKKKQRNLHNP